jgi:hypothetical protein
VYSKGRIPWWHERHKVLPFFIEALVLCFAALNLYLFRFF